MTKLKTAALVAALSAFAAGSAFAGEIRVPVSGKSTEQIHADIVRAASQLCWQDVRGDALAGYIYPECVRRSVKSAIAQIGDAQLAAYDRANPAPVHYAAR